MARWMTPTPEQEQGLAAWIAERPQHVRAIFERLDLYELYRMKSTGQRVTLQSVSDDGTVTVNVSGEFNAVLFPRRVSGVDPDDLEPCDLPGPDEVLGAALTAEEAEVIIDLARVHVRPDLWELDERGVAVRRQT